MRGYDPKHRRGIGLRQEETGPLVGKEDRIQGHEGGRLIWRDAMNITFFI